MVYSFSNFGYEGSLIQIESDVRNGEKALDIIGISDSIVKESKARIESAIAGCSAIQNRCLVSCSPVGVKKDDEVEFAIALDLLSYNDNFIKYLIRDFDVLALGEIASNGEIFAPKGIRNAIKKFAETETENALKVVICSTEAINECKNIDENLEFLFVDNIREVKKALENRLANNEVFEKLEYTKSDSKEVKFDDDFEVNAEVLKGLSDSVENLAIAIAGKHHILAIGEAGSGRTLIFQYVVPYLMPRLTDKENDSVLRIKSQSGLFKDIDNKAPFRMPHQISSIEGMCGGGINCRAGEISLAHNGVLFLDDASEFKSSVLQMLRVPLMNGYITLSRAGRSTSYPTNFQLMMSTNPCPCGHYTTSNRRCLCSEKSIEQFWKKFSAPLLDRITIKMKVEKKDNAIPNLQELRNLVKTAYDMQRERNIYNEHLSGSKLEYYCKVQTTEEQKEQFEQLKNECSEKQLVNALKVARTIADMHGREDVYFRDFQKAIEITKNLYNL